MSPADAPRELTSRNTHAVVARLLQAAAVGRAVIDIPCGEGAFLARLRAHGVEGHGADLVNRVTLPGARFTAADMNAPLPFGDAGFDAVYSWGVIHHSEHPKAIVAEARRVLRPGGVFIGMVYARHSVVALKVWLKSALLRGRPWRTFADVLRHHMESMGTKGYTPAEVEALLSEFRHVELLRCITPYDTKRFPALLSQFFPAAWGWNLCFRAYR